MNNNEQTPEIKPLTYEQLEACLRLIILEVGDNNASDQKWAEVTRLLNKIRESYKTLLDPNNKEIVTAGKTV